MTGTVLWFHQLKSSGFVTSAGGTNYFVYRNEAATGDRAWRI